MQRNKGNMPAVPLEDRRRRRMRAHWNEVWNQKVLFLFLVPAVVFTLVFHYRPMYGVIMAFQQYNILRGLGGSEFIGIENFASLLVDPHFFRSVRNTVALSSLNLLIVFPIPILFAILLNEYGFRKFNKFVQSVAYLPHFISWVIVAGLLYRLLDEDNGAVNVLLMAAGFEKIAFFREPGLFWGIFTSSNIWKETGWSAILYLSAMAAINPELYEAAIVDGAGRLRRIWHITLPGIMSTVVLLFILTVSNFFNGAGMFEPAYALRNPMLAETSDIIDVYAYFTGVRQGDYGFAAAIGLLQSLTSILILFSVNRGMKRWTGYSLF